MHNRNPVNLQNIKHLYPVNRRYLQTLKPNKAVLALYEEVLKDIQADKYKESDIEISKLHKELERCELRRENIGIDTYVFLSI